MITRQIKKKSVTIKFLCINFFWRIYKNIISSTFFPQVTVLVLNNMLKPDENEIESTQMEISSTTEGKTIATGKEAGTTTTVQSTESLDSDFTVVTPPPPPPNSAAITTTVASVTSMPQHHNNNNSNQQNKTISFSAADSPMPSSPRLVAAEKTTKTTGATGAGTAKQPFVAKMQSKVKFIPECRKEQLNTRYLATLPGVLKIAEVLLCFVAFILAICADRKSTSSSWTEHITFECTLVVAVLCILYVMFPHLTLADERTRQGLVVVEMLFYGINTVFFFISIWLMVYLATSWTAEGRGAAIMDAILCLALCALFGIETYIKFKAWSGQEVIGGGGDGSRTNSPYGAHHVPPAPTHHEGKENAKDDHVMV